MNSSIDGGFKAILKTLVQDPAKFTPDDASCAIHEIMKGTATHSQISAFLISLRLQQKDSDPTIVAACAQAMRSHARLIAYDHYQHLEGNVVDIVGTGGDGHDTYNVSTTASIVAAGAGAKVAKVYPALWTRELYFINWSKICNLFFLARQPRCIVQIRFSRSHGSSRLPYQQGGTEPCPGNTGKDELLLLVLSDISSCHETCGGFTERDWCSNCIQFIGSNEQPCTAISSRCWCSLTSDRHSDGQCAQIDRH